MHAFVVWREMQLRMMVVFDDEIDDFWQEFVYFPKIIKGKCFYEVVFLQMPSFILQFCQLTFHGLSLTILTNLCYH